MDIISQVQQVICFAFHDSKLLMETCQEAKNLRKIVTLFYLDWRNRKRTLSCLSIDYSLSWKKEENSRVESGRDILLEYEYLEEESLFSILE